MSRLWKSCSRQVQAVRHVALRRGDPRTWGHGLRRALGRYTWTAQLRALKDALLPRARTRTRSPVSGSLSQRSVPPEEKLRFAPSSGSAERSRCHPPAADHSLLRRWRIRVQLRHATHGSRHVRIPRPAGEQVDHMRTSRTGTPAHARPSTCSPSRPRHATSVGRGDERCPRTWPPAQSQAGSALYASAVQSYLPENTVVSLLAPIGSCCPTCLRLPCDRLRCLRMPARWLCRPSRQAAKA
jgi:hypothetical protein